MGDTGAFWFDVVSPRHSSTAKDKRPTLVVLNLSWMGSCPCPKAYTKLELAKDKIGVGRMIAGRQ